MGGQAMTMQQAVNAMKDWMEQNPLRKKRTALKASKDHAAVLMGVSMSTIKGWENGAHLPSQTSMERIAEFLEVSIDEAQRLWDDWWMSRPGRTKKTDERVVAHGGRPF